MVDNSWLPCKMCEVVYAAYMKNPRIAAALNVIPGLGYVYIDSERRVFGGILLVATIFMYLSGLDPRYQTEEFVNAAFTVWDGYAFVCIILIVGALMYDSYHSCVQHNTTGKKGQ